MGISNLKKARISSWMWLILFCIIVLSSSSYSQTYIPGVSVYNSNNYVEYIPGDLPIVISVPHGGYLEPADIPNRDCDGCVYSRDSYTQELARSMNEAFYEQMGGYAHFIINLLHRKKFDANRDIGDAADGNNTVEQVWYDYHDLINVAKDQIEEDHGRGLFIDLHGHGHDIQRLELGYLLSGSELRLPNSQLNSSAILAETSIRSLVSDNWQSLTHADIIRGFYSFGNLIDRKGYPAVPSKNDRYPYESQPYFNGGYNTVRHSSIEGGNIDGFQIECNQSIRFDTSKRNTFAEELTRALNEYYDLHYDDDYIPINDYLVTSIKENHSEETIQIFPNPATTEINLNSELKNIHIQIYDVFGKQVTSLSWQGHPID
ncbi:MAG: hypothetical protein ABFS32_15755, partial [Bacteroidota bacterium]